MFCITRAALPVILLGFVAGRSVFHSVSPSM